MVTSGVLLWFTGSVVAANTSEAEIDSALQAFANTHSPVRTLKVDALQASPELLDPSTRLPSTHMFAYDSVRALRVYERGCAGSPTAPPNDPALNKAWRWAAFRCGQKELPPTFFETPPFIHPFGSSYVLR